MIYQDYIMRMIEQIVRVLAKILFNKETGNYRGSLDEVDSALKELVGLDYNFLAGLSDKDIIALLKMYEDNEITGAKCFAAGKLIKEAADLKAAANSDNEINSEYLKALSLYLEGILSNKNSKEIFSAYFKDIDEILGKVKENEIPPEIKSKLIKFNELTGKI